VAAILSPTVYSTYIRPVVLVGSLTRSSLLKVERSPTRIAFVKVGPHVSVEGLKFDYLHDGLEDGRREMRPRPLLSLFPLKHTIRLHENWDQGNAGIDGAKRLSCNLSLNFEWVNIRVLTLNDTKEEGNSLKLLYQGVHRSPWYHKESKERRFRPSPLAMICRLLQ
jgi:hypothetical protein